MMDIYDVITEIQMNAEGDEELALSEIVNVLENDTSDPDVVNEAVYRAAQHFKTEWGHVQTAYRTLLLWQGIIEIREHYNRD